MTCKGCLQICSVQRKGVAPMWLCIKNCLILCLKNGRMSLIDLHLLLLCNRFDYYELMMMLFSIDLFF
ncbi:hypothetical protein HanXRQr2_Chr15g0695991 [Helianthus annuus]|uniref:Uncharacterized protein n=1 Tax=Helianthus annuus TaxID=4232 RepID=A0A9K3E2F2_HELAN|nr:hypothetical protein HanXRQr2_Chr15g0695991 [Helianthus annuus]KAJ0831508.1 hypothetical protein HanPSC8_Chr15g0667831 [Helianthus annuus]